MTAASSCAGTITVTAGRDVVRAHGPRPQAGEAGRRERVAGVRPGERAQAAPEQAFQEDMARERTGGNPHAPSVAR